MKYIMDFSEIGIADIGIVGGKNASLGELYNNLSALGINVPGGFAVTADAFRFFIRENQLAYPLKQLLAKLGNAACDNLADVGKACRGVLLAANLPPALEEALLQAYRAMNAEGVTSVAVRSSATAEDLPGASFAGLHESFLNIQGEQALLQAVTKCFASLYTDRAIKYRIENGFAHDQVALSVGIQKMVRSDRSCSGVCFTLEPETGFPGVVHISGVWGLGENMVQGTVTPDEFLVFKPTLKAGRYAILQKVLGSKEKWMRFSEDKSGAGVINTDTPEEMQHRLILNDDAIQQLARWSVAIEDHYKRPMDIEWARDGLTNDLFILQARPETVHSKKKDPVFSIYRLKGSYPIITKGTAVGGRIVSGIARILTTPEEATQLQTGDILVTTLTSPDWDPFLKKAGGIITDKGGRTSHASIIAREMGTPAVVGCGDATRKIRNGMPVTISCAEGKEGYIYAGRAEWTEEIIQPGNIRMPAVTAPMLIISDPGKAFLWSSYPNKGVGLLRMEFIISNVIRIHPMALVQYETLQDITAREQIEQLTIGYVDKRQYFIEKLAQAVATIAAAFYPREVVVRMSDFKTNEYAHLLGGSAFEPREENPMLGFRGASRYYHPLYRAGFGLECAAMKKVRDEMGLVNVRLMIPFCRTVEEGRKVVAVMREEGLIQGANGLELYMMAEIPSNVLLATEFAQVFDGFSIGSNDLTQLVLGVDRDSGIVASLFSERDPAAMKMIADMIAHAKKQGKRIGLCGQRPSDDPAFAEFLVEAGIDSISFNPDALLNGIANMVQAEQKLLP
ncbi:phosphoenolpyruvate synthase [Niabella drilacis]|uniref:Phosphoenolpyruvate synthase n=1 Tax=Niabella drilacis (strain DSM 25811 / CCM 8410 / CCUG 62505 / LMG 26954 / E90) TaxID=1285928 RepID=A0A1G6RCI2_NIADE|nr:phosphoenolpyruvate synthase [Niabella drilacis]SDD02151.1 phosphoenolpyruvate synthase [Niabella drilacis]